MSKVVDDPSYRALAENWLDVFQGDSVGFVAVSKYVLQAIEELEVERGTVPKDKK